MTNIIKALHRTQRIVVDPGTSGVAIVQAGPIGPRGLRGPTGSSGEGAVVEYTQVSPSSSWVIDHNLGVYPIYNVLEAETNAILEPSEIHHSVNQLELQFNTPRAGIARLRS